MLADGHLLAMYTCTHWALPLCVHTPAVSLYVLMSLLFFFFINLFIYLLLVVLGLHRCTQAFSSCSEWGLLFFAVRRLLIEVASLVAEHGL